MEPVLNDSHHMRLPAQKETLALSSAVLSDLANEQERLQHLQRPNEVSVPSIIAAYFGTYQVFACAKSCKLFQEW